MNEADKGWRRSTKLHAAIAAGFVVVIIWLTNFHDKDILLAVIDICKYVLSVVFVARAGLTGFQSYTERFSFRPPTNFVPSNTPQEESR